MLLAYKGTKKFLHLQIFSRKSNAKNSLSTIILALNRKCKSEPR